MSKRVFASGLFALAMASVFALASPASAQQGQPQAYGPMMGPGMMYGCGPGCGQGMMTGPGMMYGNGQGYYYGMPVMGYWAQPRDLNLSVADVRGYLERWVAWSGNQRVRAGPVTQRDEDTITADIVTADRSVLVQRYVVDRHTGAWQPAP